LSEKEKEMIFIKEIILNSGTAFGEVALKSASPVILQCKHYAYS
jgi:hypothetical protein